MDSSDDSEKAGKAWRGPLDLELRNYTDISRSIQGDSSADLEAPHWSGEEVDSSDEKVGDSSGQSKSEYCSSEEADRSDKPYLKRR
jgi:hypothetical protein